MATLQTLAENTDGRAIVNRNDLAKGMEQIVRDSSAYYLLGYNSTQAPQDGKFHPIRVRDQAAGRPGARPQGLLGALGRRTRRASTAAPKAGPPPAVAKAIAGIASAAPIAGSSGPGLAPARARTAGRR